MKNFVLASVAILGVTYTVNAQTLQEAIKKTENERFEAASADFKSLIAKEPGKGDYYFYYGENFFRNNDLDSAMIMYTKGAETSAMYPLNFVGIGKVYLWQNKESDANTNIFKAKTLADDKTNKAVKALTLMKIAEAYTNAPTLKNLPEAIKLLDAAAKLEKNNPEILILKGDALLEQNPTDGGAPIKAYSDAFELDKKSVKAILRKGKLYERGRNYTEALKYYKDAEAIDANFAPAYREKAEIYMKASRYKEAIENYKKYLELNNSPSARVRFAYALYLGKQYQDAVTEIEQILQKESSSSSTPYLKRVLGYSYYELGDKTDKEAYKKGDAALSDFFNLTNGKDFKYIPDDYKYRGMLLSKTGQDSLGVIELEKAIALDPVANCELAGDIGKIWLKIKRYDKALAAYEKREKCTKPLTSQDYFDIGRAYFFGPKDLVKADTSFSKMNQLTPATYPVGYFWRGKVNVQMDLKNEKWLAKPFYEEAMNRIKPEERASYKANVIEACE
ncbi:MAG TPA: tetratricopeptide repeat protein, partial [Bacteroidia bacterium]